jgi:V/A-type H+-transporting ATPase subunit K
MLFDPTALAIIGGALALVGGLIGSSIGIGVAGSAGAATLSEDSSQFRNVLILAVLPMTQTLYGLIVLILIISGPVANMDAIVAAVGSGAAPWFGSFRHHVCCAKLFSAIYQGNICDSGIALLPRPRARF